MIPAFWFLLRLAVLVAAIMWLRHEPGDVTVVWQGYEIKTSVAFLLAAVAAVALVWSAIDRLWRFLLAAPGLLRRHRALQRREKGYKALTTGFVAVAAGDAAAAARAARLAALRISDVPLTLLLSAQAAQLNGDQDTARRLFGDLLAHESASFLGLRGLLAEKIRLSDHAGALDLVKAAAAKEPRRRWILQQLYALEIKNNDWPAALKTLNKIESHRLMAPTDIAAQRVALLLASARTGGGRPTPAQQRALHRAWRLSPSFVPAALAWNDALIHFGNIKEAQKVLRRAYQDNPHPDIGARWMSFYQDPLKSSPHGRDRRKYDWALQLAGGRRDDREAQRFLGRVALSAGLWQEAEDHLFKAADAEGLSGLRRHSGHGVDAEMTPVPFPAWVCNACGQVSAAWHPVSLCCQTFNALEWTVPGHVQPRVFQANAALADASWIGPPA
ncbi:MAG: heme biosynthesis HemY N-terminal domain-containing protein [Bdellovibrionales bacterium]